VDQVRVEVGNRELGLSNLDKVLYPDVGFTKAAVVDYYARIAPFLVPHLARRALTLVRAPDGVEGERFFEKRCPPHRPDWVHHGGALDSCLVDDAPTLVWLANLAALELHTHQHVVDAPQTPTAVVFDLDPGPPATVVDCARVALDLQSLLDRLGLSAVVKTSGSKGLHLSVPVNGGHPDVTDEITKRFALAIGNDLAAADAEHGTVDRNKAVRPNRVFVDWSQNDRHKTTICAYSLRIAERPTVSTPVTWDEVHDVLDHGDADAFTFEAPDVLERVAGGDDHYAASLTVHQVLPELAPG
jgi:bifunctional non-homologous end joining protein LigD